MISVVILQPGVLTNFDNRHDNSSLGNDLNETTGSMPDVVNKAVIKSGDKIRWDTNGYVKADVLEVQGNMVAVGHNCTAIIAQTSAERATALANAIAGITDSRPDVYEGFSNVLTSFNITLEAVLMNNFEKDTYYSDAIFILGDKAVQMDMKPSDAFVIALRSEAPIYINETILEKNGVDICKE
jgi:bifunctional DNase/RNase